MLGKEIRAAAASGNTAELVRLLALGESAALSPDSNGSTALHLAAAAGHDDISTALLLAGSKVNAVDSSGCTPLQLAAAEGYLDIVNQLIKHGADVNKQDNVHGNTALHEASWKGFSKTVAALCKSKINMHIKNFGGFAALHLCCQNGHNQSCRELLIAGCSPDLQNNYGDTPLHTSARYGHAGVTRILISGHCQVSDQNKNGDTALHISAAMGRRKMTRILLEAGCDKNLRNKQNETAQDIATRKDLNEILTILNSSSNADKKHLAKKREKQGSGTSSKDSNSHKKEKKKNKNEHKVHFDKVPASYNNLSSKNWSPYGCHYYPDSKQFPSPKLDSLPDEPLQKGEQYFLDLAGNICKGPVGVGYTCYCAPFFRHMEEKLEKDKIELKKHIDSAEQRLDKKVQNLERRTEVRLSQLRMHHKHIAQWLQSENSLTRTKSLDLLDDKSLLNEKLENCCLNPIEDQITNSRLDHHSMENVCSVYQNESRCGTSKDNIGKFWRDQFIKQKNIRKCRSSSIDKSKRVDLSSSANEVSSGVQNLDSNCAIEPNFHVPKSGAKERKLPDWGGYELRKSVHEMVSKIQASQRNIACKDGEERAEIEPWEEVRISSDCSDEEDCEHKGSWQEVRRLPYRSRSAVYSPTLDRDQNDSGYSTKICSNSQGPSPSLSVRLQQDDLLPPQQNFYPPLFQEEQPESKCQTIFPGEASLV
uniref:Uncharacterized protein n=1 Tax=Clastoptera arizonana TaxID=38151 RepID=A0A1B6DYF3_9HEMI